MKIKLRIGSIAVIGLALITYAVKALGKQAEIAPQLYEVPSVTEILGRVENPRARAILTDLVRCESGGNPGALNPIDLDGTPSHGILQFKDTTLLHFVKRYQILPTIEAAEIGNVLYDPELQIKTAESMIEEYGDNKAFWAQQWPDCSRKHNYWQTY